MDEDDGFFEAMDNDSFVEIKGLIPANPICVKARVSEEPKPVLKM